MKRKNRANFRKHSVTFGTAAVVPEEKKPLEPGDALTPETQENTDELPANPGRGVDTPDISELGLEFWKDAVRGRFYRPVKQAVSLRLDADVLAWLKKDGEGYQTRANRILRERMLEDLGVK